MTSKQFHSSFLAYCKSNADEAIVQKYARYFREGYDAWGLTQAHMDTWIKEVNSSPDFNMELLLDVAPRLIKSGKYEETSVVLSLLNKNHRHFDKSLFTAIAGWFSIGIHNWAHADMLGMQILPVFLLKEIVNMQDFNSWISSTHKFQRRCVPVTFIKPVKGGQDAGPFIRFIEPLMMDKERVVHQGAGWFLRECWRRQPEVTEAFLMKWKDKSPRLIFQYACEKMDAGEKAKFRKG